MALEMTWKFHSIHSLASRILNCVAVWSIITQSCKKESHLLSNYLDSTFWYLPLKVRRPVQVLTMLIGELQYLFRIILQYKSDLSLKFDWQYYIFSQRTFFCSSLFYRLGTSYCCMTSECRKLHSYFARSTLLKKLVILATNDGQEAWNLK